jgi:hypothetical protein
LAPCNKVSKDGVHETWGRGAKRASWPMAPRAGCERGAGTGTARVSKSRSGSQPRGRRLVGAGGWRPAGGERGQSVDWDDIALATGSCGPWRACWQRWPTEDGITPTRLARQRHVGCGSRRSRPRRRVSRRYLPIEWIGARKYACRKYRARPSIPGRLRKLWGRASSFRSQR